MDDLISRQAAIDAVYKCTDIYINNLPVMVDKADAYKALAELPSVTPKQKRGKWEEKEVARIDDLEAKDIIAEWQSAKCNVCGKYHTTPYMYYFDNYNFCPNCGSYNGEEYEK